MKVKLLPSWVVRLLNAIAGQRSAEYSVTFYKDTATLWKRGTIIIQGEHSDELFKSMTERVRGGD